ncbi:hypothetical protein CEH05_09470 [Halobacillus halophilus]|uniref:Uncharacterized protein n=2 Tax=Bacillaceae TaxID=186817 RepID=I0JM82_HALH3|nr:hypothetical protein CEH05_09470 [Halobacillus halophilus]CCG45252.1 hypothetical protein HBHAL_2904 [Halobacillus halophilus DSM 2266]
MVMILKSRKHSFFILMNASLGLLTCFVYLYTWVAFSFMESMFSWQPLLSLAGSITLFILWNMYMLKRERNRYWAQAIFSYVGSIVIFAYFLT